MIRTLYSTSTRETWSSKYSNSVFLKLKWAACESITSIFFFFFFSSPSLSFFFFWLFINIECVNKTTATTTTTNEITRRRDKKKYNTRAFAFCSYKCSSIAWNMSVCRCGDQQNSFSSDFCSVAFGVHFTAHSMRLWPEKEKYVWRFFGVFLHPYLPYCSHEIFIYIYIGIHRAPSNRSNTLWTCHSFMVRIFRAKIRN